MGSLEASYDPAIVDELPKAPGIHVWFAAPPKDDLMEPLESWPQELRENLEALGYI